MSRPLCAVAVPALAVLLLSGCSGPQPVINPTLATDGSLTYDGRGDYAGVEGVLRTEQAGGSLCVYVDSTAGLGEGRVNLVFPAGYSAVGDRAVRDTEESIVASKGDRVVVSTMPELSEEVPAGCSSAGVGTARALHLEQASG